MPVPNCRLSTALLLPSSASNCKRSHISWKLVELGILRAFSVRKCDKPCSSQLRRSFKMKLLLYLKILIIFDAYQQQCLAEKPAWCRDSTKEAHSSPLLCVDSSINKGNNKLFSYFLKPWLLLLLNKFKSTYEYRKYTSQDMNYCRFLNRLRFQVLFIIWSS